MANKNKQSKQGLSDKINYAILIIISVLIIIIVAYPLYYVLIASFSDPYDVYAGKTLLLPSNFTLSGYKAVFAEPKLIRGFLNSVIYTSLGTIYSVLMVIAVAYPLSKRDMPFRTALSVFFLITMYFGGGLIPSYLVVKETGLLGNILALFLPGGVAVGHVILTRNYFERSIPEELIESAEIDGASQLTILNKVILPLSKPILAVIVIFSMVAYWNDWFTPMIYLSQDQASFQLVLRDVLTASSISASQSSMVSGGYAELNKVTESIKFASIIVASAPMLIIYPFVQKYFEKGLFAGSVKG